MNTTEEAPGDRTAPQCQDDTSGVIDVEDRGDSHDNRKKSDAVDICRNNGVGDGEKRDIGTSETCHVKDSNDDNYVNSNSIKTVRSVNSLDAVTNGVTQMTLMNGDYTQSTVQPSDVVVEPEDGGGDVLSDTTADVICHTASSRSTGDDVKRKDTDITEHDDTVNGKEKCDVVTVTGKDSDLTEQCDTHLVTEKDTDITEKGDMVVVTEKGSDITEKGDMVVVTEKDTDITEKGDMVVVTDKGSDITEKGDMVVVTEKDTDITEKGDMVVVTEKDTDITEKCDMVVVTDKGSDITEKGDMVVVTEKDTDITEKGDMVVVTEKDTDITEKCDMVVVTDKGSDITEKGDMVVVTEKDSDITEKGYAVVVTENDTDTARNHDVAGDKAENKPETKAMQIVPGRVPDISVSMATEPTDTVVVTVTPDVSDTADVSSALAKLTSPMVTVSDTSGHVTQLTPCHDSDIELCHLERMTANLHLSASSSTSTPLNYRSVPVIRSDDDASLATQLDLDLFADAPESSPQVRGHGRRSLDTISLKDGGYKAKACHHDGSLLGQSLNGHLHL